MSKQYRVQDRTRNYLTDLNKRVSNKKSRYRREKGIELNPVISTKKPSDFTSRKELEKYVRDMKRFLKRDVQFVKNADNVVFSTKYVQRYKKAVERINNLQNKEKARIANLDTQIKGKSLGMKLGERMKMASSSLFPNLKNLSGSLDRFKSEQELKQLLGTRFEGGYFRNDFITRVNRTYKQNFIESLKTEFGSKSANLRKKIDRMSLHDFMDVYYATLGTIDIKYVYNDNKEEDTRLSVLERTFNFKQGE